MKGSEYRKFASKDKNAAIVCLKHGPRAFLPMTTSRTREEKHWCGRRFVHHETASVARHDDEISPKGEENCKYWGGKLLPFLKTDRRPGYKGNSNFRKSLWDMERTNITPIPCVQGLTFFRESFSFTIANSSAFCVAIISEPIQWLPSSLSKSIPFCCHRSWAILILYLIVHYVY